jgi:hypothetical protein
VEEWLGTLAGHNSLRKTQEVCPGGAEAGLLVDFDMVTTSQRHWVLFH